MVKQYPDLIMGSLPGQSATKDANGNWHQAGEPVDYSFNGRYEPADGNGLIKGQNGESLNYSGIIYAPKNVMLLPFGTQVTVIKSLDANVSSSSIYLPSNEVIEITTGDTGSAIDDSSLVGKRFSIERRGIGRLKASEWNYTSTGIQLVGIDVHANETFFAYVYAVQNPVSIINGVPEETVSVDTVKRFSRGQLNCRIWL